MLSYSQKLRHVLWLTVTCGVLSGCVPIWALDDFASEGSGLGSEIGGSQETPTPASIPAGYNDLGVGIAAKFVERDCSVSLYGCQWLELYAYEDCQSLVYIEANLMDPSGVVLGLTNGTLGSLKTGQKGLIELISLYEDATSIELTDATCL